MICMVECVFAANQEPLITKKQRNAGLKKLSASL